MPSNYNIQKLTGFELYDLQVELAQDNKVLVLFDVGEPYHSGFAGVFTSIVNLLEGKLAERPIDETHSYGHWLGQQGRPYHVALLDWQKW